MSAFWDMIKAIEKACKGDIWELNEKLNSISPSLEKEMKRNLVISDEDALEKLLYLSFRFPWLTSSPAFPWYPELVTRILNKLQKGAYRDKLRSVLRKLSTGIKDDKRIANKRGRPPSIRRDIIRYIQYNILRFAGLSVPSDFTTLYRAN